MRKPFPKIPMFFWFCVLWLFIFSVHMVELQASERDKESSFSSIQYDIFPKILRFCDHETLVQFAQVEKKANEIANCIAFERAEEDFCLSKEDQYGNSWIKTYACYNIFWKYQRDPKAMKTLAQQGFFLAKIHSSFENDEIYLNSLQDLDNKILKSENYLALFRDVFMYEVTTSAQRSLGDNFAQEKYKNDVKLFCEKIMGLHMDLGDDFSTALETVVTYLYEKIREQGNTSYILFMQHNTCFSNGVSEAKRLDLYLKAQQVYLKKYGKIHTGKFKYDFLIPNWPLCEETEASLDYFNSETLNREELPSIRMACEELIKMGDNIWTERLKRLEQYIN